VNRTWILPGVSLIGANNTAANPHATTKAHRCKKSSLSRQRFPQQKFPSVPGAVLFSRKQVANCWKRQRGCADQSPRGASIVALARIVQGVAVEQASNAARVEEHIVAKYVDAIKRTIGNTDRTVHLLDAAVQGIANQSALFNEKLSQIVQGFANQAGVSHHKFDQAIEGLRNQTQVLNERHAIVIANQQAQLELQRRQVEAMERMVTVGCGETK
jgi:hypothetical protein